MHRPGDGAPSGAGAQDGPDGQAPVDPLGPEAVAKAVRGLAVGLAAVAEATAPVLEAVTGYKAAAAAQGFSSAVCDEMAVQYHGFLLQAMMINFAAGEDKA